MSLWQRHPVLSTRRRIDRLMGVEGRSGLSREYASTDISSQNLAGPLNSRCRFVGQLESVLQVRAGTANIEHTPAGRNQFAILQGRSSVEHLDALKLSSRSNAGDALG
jgi:hypothetical protein